MNRIIVTLLRGRRVEADLIPPQEIGRLQNFGFRFHSETRWTGRGEVTFLRARFDPAKFFFRRLFKRRQK